MIRKNLTPQDIRREGCRALLERLGPVGAIRFIQQYDAGRGDYTAERKSWLGDLTIDEVLEKERDQNSES
jgi:hypothetical protein